MSRPFFFKTIDHRWESAVFTLEAAWFFRIGKGKSATMGQQG
jgi:hypothetical protein